jgi:hypothetical protein
MYCISMASAGVCTVINIHSSPVCCVFPGVAIDCQDCDVISLLIQHGCHVDYGAKMLKSSLYLAAKLGSLAMVTLLLEAGASMKLKYVNGKVHWFHCLFSDKLAVHRHWVQSEFEHLK